MLEIDSFPQESLQHFNPKEPQQSEKVNSELISKQSASDIFMTYSLNGAITESGNLKISGQDVLVAWKAEFPVFYVIMTDGELHGTWNDGTAVEKLSPVEKNKNQTQIP